MDPYDEDIENAADDPEQVTLSQGAVCVVLKDSDTLLVETVSAYPPLYDKSVKEYHISDIRQNCWEMVAEITNISVAYCQKRWTQLRDSFTSEKRRRNNDQRSGSGATKRKGFALYNDMEFLHKHIVPKKTFTNIPATSSSARLQQSNMHPSPQLGPVHRFPGSTSTITFQDDTLVSNMLGETNFPTQLEWLSSFPPTPESNSSTPPPISNMPSPSPEPSTTTSTLPPITYPLVPGTRTPNSEALAAPPKAASSNVQEGSSAFHKVTCTETSVKSGSYNLNVSALSSPPLPAPPSRTPTPRSTLLSPVSPYSSCSDMSYTFSPDEISETATSRSSVTPTSCYTKDHRKGKKVDPVERSFLSLSSVMQDHFAQKTFKPPEVNNAIDSNTEDAFVSLIATELQKMDDQTKKQKKARIIQILYE